MLRRSTPFQRFLSFFAISALGASCAATELSTSSTHPAHPRAPVADLSFATPLQTGRNIDAVSPADEGRAEEGHHDRKPAGHEGRAAPTPAAATPNDSKPASASFTCVMHPKIVRDKPGNCPICGMKLVPKKDGQ